MNLEELLVTAERQGIELWIDGEQLRCRASSKVSEEMIVRLRGHKGEIIRILQRGTATGKAPELPAWCSTDCQYLDLAGLPGGQPASMPGCFREDGAGGWVWTRLDKMNGCPSIRLQLSRLPAWCNRQCQHYREALNKGNRQSAATGRMRKAAIGYGYGSSNCGAVRCLASASLTTGVHCHDAL